MNEEAQRKLSTAGHWDSRYAGTKNEGLGGHEWYRTFDDIHSLLTTQLPPPNEEPRILHLGCGVSEVTQQLYTLGYENQCSIDFSSVAIEAMRERHSDMPGAEWLLMDVRNMTFADATFDVCFDKGTLDSMLWGSLWDPDEEVRANVMMYVDEVVRCLMPGGRWLCVTYQQPHFIRPLLEREGIWKLNLETLRGGDGTFEYFAWVIEKHRAPLLENG